MPVEALQPAAQVVLTEATQPAASLVSGWVVQERVRQLELAEKLQQQRTREQAAMQAKLLKQSEQLAEQLAAQAQQQLKIQKMTEGLQAAAAAGAAAKQSPPTPQRAAAPVGQQQAKGTALNNTRPVNPSLPGQMGQDGCVRFEQSLSAAETAQRLRMGGLLGQVQGSRQQGGYGGQQGEYQGGQQGSRDMGQQGGYSGQVGFFQMLKGQSQLSQASREQMADMERERAQLREAAERQLLQQELSRQAEQVHLAQIRAGFVPTHYNGQPLGEQQGGQQFDGHGRGGRGTGGRGPPPPHKHHLLNGMANPEDPRELTKNQQRSHDHKSALQQSEYQRELQAVYEKYKRGY
jgi:hypothetical protein